MPICPSVSFSDWPGLSLGGGMSSRLFQEVREKRGLAYSVYSYAQGYSDDGIFGVYVGCLPAKIDDVLSNFNVTGEEEVRAFLKGIIPDTEGGVQ